MIIHFKVPLLIVFWNHYDSEYVVTLWILNNVKEFPEMKDPNGWKAYVILQNIYITNNSSKFRPLKRITSIRLEQYKGERHKLWRRKLGIDIGTMYLK